MRRFSALLLAAFLSTLPAAAMADPQQEAEQLRQLATQLQQQLEALQQRIKRLEQNVSENQQAVEANAEAVEATAVALEEQSMETVLDRVSIGGYGELHYNNLNAESPANDKEEIDFHRFVLFFGYDFSDHLKFFSELELEHSLAGEGAPGELELEQAFVEYAFAERHAARVGLFLLPIGILNETHEPTTFYGVERNNVESVIIPTTWWAGGVGYTMRNDHGLQLDLALHEGLRIPDSGGNTARARSGRQKTANADANGMASTARIKYTGRPGLELAASLQYQPDPGVASGNGLDDGLLYEAHAIYDNGPFGFRALYAGWEFGTNSGTANGARIDRLGLDSQYGWYLEPSYKLNDSFGVFVRYEDVEGGRVDSVAGREFRRDHFSQWVVGFNWWLHEQVVIKADYIARKYDADAVDKAGQHNFGVSDGMGGTLSGSGKGRGFDGFNLGFGYYF